MQYTSGNRIKVAIEMRKRGQSYSEISAALLLPRSTVVSWLRKIKLTPEQRQKLFRRRSETAKNNSAARKLELDEAIAKIKISSASDITRISKRELWLMGIMLYWRENFSLNDKVHHSRGVSFTSSDPSTLKFFMRWLFEIGGLSRKEIIFDIFLRRNLQSVSALEQQRIRTRAINYWAEITDFPVESFAHIYFHNLYLRKTAGVRHRERRESSPFGFLRLRVRRSSLLSRQITGWIDGIKRIT